MKHVARRLFRSCCAYFCMAIVVTMTSGCFQDAKVTSTGSSFFGYTPTFDDSGSSAVTYTITSLGTSSFVIAGDCPRFGEQVEISDGSVDGNGEKIWIVPAGGDTDCAADGRFSVIVPTDLPSSTFAAYLTNFNDTHEFNIRMSTSYAFYSGEGAFALSYQSTTSLARHWVGGGGDSNWSNASNWFEGLVPGASEIAIFDNGCVGANCNCAINTAANVAGIDMQATYTGILTQSNLAITIGSSDFTVNGGTFTANGTADIDINGSLIVDGGSFNMTGSNLAIAKNFTHTASGSFSGSTSRVIFDSPNSATITPGAAIFYDAKFSKSAATALTLMYDITVSNDLYLSSSTSGVLINDYAIIVAGDTYVTAFGAGGTTNVLLNGAADQNVFQSGATWPINLTVNKTTGNALLTSNLTLSNTDLDVVSGDLIMGGFSISGINQLSVQAGHAIYKGCGTLAYNTLTAGSIIYEDDYGLQIDIAGASDVFENISPQTFAVSLSAINCVDTEVTYSTTDGTAIDSIDYTAATGTLTIPAGSLTRTVFVTILDDAAYEASPEYYTVGISATSLGIGAGTVVGTGQINDDESPPTVSFSAGTSSANENIGSHNIIMNLTQASYQTIVVGYTVTAGTATGTGTDYTMSNASVTFSPGQTSTTLTAVFVNDSANETNETFNVTITSTSNSTTGAIPTQSVTILDDDFIPTVTSVASSSGSGQYSDGQNVSIQVNFDYPVAVTGTPVLALNTTPARSATYSTGTGTTALTFVYSVQVDDISADLNYVNNASFTLSGGTIKSISGALLNAQLTLPNVGSGALGDTYNIIINPRPKITASTCMLDGYTTESFLGCGYTPTNAADSMDGTTTYTRLTGNGSDCAWVTLNASTGAVTGTPTLAQAGRCEIRLQVSDGHFDSAVYTSYVNVHSSKGIAQVVQSGFHGCALVEGMAKCWGLQQTAAPGLGDGALALGYYNNHAIARVSNSITVPIMNFTRLSVGGNSISSVHTCGRYSGGSLNCWGSNDTGQLGNGTLTTSGYPISVSTVSNVTSLASGPQHNCAVMQNSSTTLTGKIMCWGSNGSGRLGDNSSTSSTTPVYVQVSPAVALTNAVSVSTGKDHTCALMANGGIKCWGENIFGQLGINSTTDSLTAVDVIGYGPVYSKRAVRVYAGDGFTCAISSVNELKCWGSNASGQLGQDNLVNLGDGASEMEALASAAAINLGTGRTPIDIAIAGASVCALLDNATIKCWGNNLSGQLGLGDLSNRGDVAGEMAALTATPLGTSAIPFEIAGGGLSFCSIISLPAESFVVKCWGRNNYGQLGNSETPLYNSSAPTWGDKGDASVEMGDNLTPVNLNPTLFVSTGTANGSTGLAGATNLCYTSASAVGRADKNTVFAVLSTTAQNISGYYTTELPIKKTDAARTKLFNHWIDMWDGGGVLAAIDKKVDGSAATGTVATGTDVSGVLMTSAHCSDWTSISGVGTSGSITSTNGTWINNSSVTCSTTFRFYCMGR